MDATLRDLKLALRSLWRSPGFSALAVLTLALGIGSATAVFSVANGVLLRPLPYAEPDEVVTVWASWDNFPDKTWLSVPEYQLFHQESRAFEDLALYRIGSAIFTDPEGAEQVVAASVTPNTFDVLGVTPVRGRAFTWEEARTGTGVLVAHETWVRRWGADPDVVGRDVQIDGRSTPLFGVLPAGFALPFDLAGTARSEVFYPLFVDLEAPAPALGTGGSHGSYGVGRLSPGASVESARADLARVMSQVPPAGLYSPARRFSPRVFAAEADVVGSSRATLLVLLGAVALLLLIACGNVANLFLSRTEARTAEVAVRRALGAGGGAMARQVLVEGAVLAGVAGVLGLGLAAIGVDALLAIDPAAVPRAAEVRLDARVASFAVAATALTVLLFGLLPALRVARAGMQPGLRAGGRGAAVTSASVRGVLVASQMAMAVVLLTGSGLLMKSFVRLLGVDTGFAAERVLTARVTAPQGAYPDAPAIAAMYDELLRRIEALPGVAEAAAVRLLPLASTMGDSFFRPVAYVAAPDEATQGEWQWATPGYFEIMGIPIVAGRTFDDGDRRDSQPVAIVNEALAARYWGTESPIGQAVLASGSLDTAIVVGVVGDVRHNGVASAPKPQYYLPHAQVIESMASTMRGMTLTVAMEGEAVAGVEALRAEVRAFDASLPVSQVATLDEVLSRSVATSRFALALLGGFAGLSLALALIGIYGVLSYVVGQRTREIGLRLAVGAERGQIVTMVVAQGLRMAGVGVAAGAALAWSLGGVLSGLLYEVAPQDPATLVSVPILFLAVALLACWIPALRATRIHPASALRGE